MRFKVHQAKKKINIQDIILEKRKSEVIQIYICMSHISSSQYFLLIDFEGVYDNPFFSNSYFFSINA